VGAVGGCSVGAAAGASTVAVPVMLMHPTYPWIEHLFDHQSGTCAQPRQPHHLWTKTG
jgi:hypothetical protein